MTLPIENSQDLTALDQLLKDCIPGTFGRGGEDVYDDTYRRARALGADEFMTDFCPCEAGIIDIVTQPLLPPLAGDLEPPLQPRPKVIEKSDSVTTYEA